MKISHGTRFTRWQSNNGYGYATDRIMDSLHYLGHEVKVNDPTAPVKLWFDQPHHWEWNKNQYKIGYHPWESTELDKSWKKAMNRTDEIWTPSPLVAQWYAEAGVKKPIHVFEHGVDADTWSPVHRKVDDKFRILHAGGESVRKGADITLDAFRVAFEGNKNVELTLKFTADGWNIKKYGNVNIVTNSLPLDVLVKLYHDHHLFVYPSWGEGFGLAPLQAMSTGMPTICTGAWAPYIDYIHEDLRVDSKMVDSPWPRIHPGRMFKPSFEDVVEKMRQAYLDFQKYSDSAYQNVPAVTEYYNWDKLTDEAFNSLENRLKI